MPLSRGGTNKRTNLVTVCRSCHGDSHGQDVHDPNTETESERWLPPIDEVRRLIRATHHPLKRAVIGVLGKTGIGVGELRNLRLRDVFLDDVDVSETYDIRKPERVETDFPAIRVRVNEEVTYPPRREQKRSSSRSMRRHAES